MPIWGTLDVADRIASAPAVEPATEPKVLEGAEVLQLMYEIDSEHSDAVLPRALHPTNPPTMTVVVWRTKDFALAQLRIGCRAGVRPRGFVLRAYVDAESHELASKWGFPCVAGEIGLRRGYDRIEVVVRAEGRTILDGALTDPEPISGGDILWVASMHLALVGGRPKLVQVDPEYAFHKADRGRPRLDIFDAEAWGEPRLRPVYPVSATWSLCDVTLPRVRYLCDPGASAMQGTERIS